MVADALVYHPTVAQFLRYAATTAGRDKFLRLVQYLSRFYAWYLYRTNQPQALITPFETAKKQLGIARKLLRLGKFVEHLQGAAVASDSRSLDPVVRFFSVSRQLGYAAYLVFDNAAILDATAVQKFESAQSFNQRAQQFWLLGIGSSIINGVYKLYGLNARRHQLNRKESHAAAESKKIEKEWHATRLQLISDMCDACIPASGLGYLAIDDGIVGLAGALSSLIGLHAVWDKVKQ